MDRFEKNEAETAEAPKAEAYEAPKVLRVSLRPAEAVLGHCKVSGSAGAVSASCRPVTGPCRTPGS
jgi:hypothetical protein